MERIKQYPISKKNNGNNSNNTQKKNNHKKYIITSKKVKEVFYLFAIDQKYLNKKTFDDALEYLFSKIPIPEIHHTYLSSKLFDILNISKTSKINLEEFINIIKEFLSKKGHRLHLSMMAMMKLPNKTKRNVDIDEVKDFFYESFISGYKHLAYQINQNKEEFKNNDMPVVTINQIEAWAREFEKKIKNGFEKDLKMLDSNITDSVSFEQYVKWLSNDQTLYIKYGFKKLMIATSLIIFDEVGFEDNMKEE